MAGPEDIEKFWTWWAGAEQRLAEALEDPDGRGTAVDEIRFRVGKAGLTGEVVFGSDVPLVVGSATGDPQYRLRAAHWLIAAPHTDRFAFATHRPPQPLPLLLASMLPGKPPVAIEELRFTHRWRELEDLVDIDVDLASAIRHRHPERIGPRVLRSALGELEAEVWLGDVNVHTGPLGDDAQHLADLLDTLTAEMAQRAVPRTERLEFTKPGAEPLVVLLNRPIQPARHPFLDTCVAIVSELQTDDPDEPERLRGQLLDGMPGDVLLVGAAIRGRVHTTVIYANGRSPTIGLLDARAAMLGGRQQTSHDPSWWSIRRFQQPDPSRAEPLPQRR